MDLSSLSGVAPQARLTLEASRLWAGPIAGFVPLCCAAISALIALVAWSRARALSAEVWQRRGLRPGPILVCGTAQRLEGGSGADPAAPIIELEIEQAGTEHMYKGAHYVRWMEISRVLRDQPFLLRTDQGDEIRVEPGGRLTLVDQLDAAEAGPGRDHRRRFARIRPGDRVWIRGVCKLGTRGPSSGPYRGGEDRRSVLRPPAGGELFVSSEPVAAEGRDKARFHGFFALAWLLVAALGQLLVFRDFHTLRTRGVSGEAEIADRRSFTTRHKNKLTTHYVWRLRYLDADGGAHDREEETNRVAFQRRSGRERVPIVYDPASPERMQLGRREELGVDLPRILLSVIALSILFGLHLAAGTLRRPWWRRPRLIESSPGRL